MRTVFFGTPDLAVPSLAALAQAHEVTAVVCRADKPKGRSKKLLPPPVKVWALEHGIPVHQPTKLNDGAFEAWLKKQAPEICTVAAYGRLLKQPILDVPPMGWLNLHPSLLPRYRGPSPIQTAILDGETETGVTIMAITLEMDSGDILLQEKVSIDPEENSEQLSERLAAIGAPLLVKGVDLVAAKQAQFRAQDPAQVKVCAMFEKQHGRIRWAESAQTIHKLVRAANPWPMAQCLLEDQVCRIHKSRVVAEDATVPPGTISVVEKDRMLVATGSGQLEILVFQAPGKKAMAIADFLRGRKMNVGDSFKDIG